MLLAKLLTLKPLLICGLVRQPHRMHCEFLSKEKVALKRRINVEIRKHCTKSTVFSASEDDIS